MKLQAFRSLWTNGFDLESALKDCREGAFHGIEGPVPTERAERGIFTEILRDSGVPFIAEICTAGSYVPDRNASVEQHLEDFRRTIDLATTCAPLFLTSLAGCDAWPLAQSVDFFGRAMALAKENGIIASFETHRSRSMFNPWITRDLLTQLPELRLTCDYSHWCCVCERLIDTEPEILALCAERAHHIHARIGYEQGPQVSHPAAAEYRPALEAHERWWQMIWSAQRSKNREYTTITPEFGPDGYLQATPFSGKPVADLDEINCWMAARLRISFKKFDQASSRSN